MKLHDLITTACVAAVLAVAPACKKQQDNQPQPTATSTGSSAAEPATPAGNVPDENVDRITVLAHHQNPKPSDPVRVTIEKFRVVSADFDPKKIEGGKATLELDLASLHTDSNKRDDHLKSSAYLDISTRTGPVRCRSTACRNARISSAPNSCDLYVLTWRTYKE